MHKEQTMIRSSAQQQGKVVVWGERARTLALCVLALSVAASFGLLLGVGPAHADTFTINSTNDREDEFVGDGACYTGVLIADPANEVGTVVPECTLRAAIEEANVNDQIDTIRFLSGLNGTITLSLGELVIANDISTVPPSLIIEGPGESKLTVSGNDASRVFKILDFAPVTISGLTISDGNDDTSGDFVGGGGIYNDGRLTLNNSTVSGNTSASVIGGGGIYNSGTLFLTNSTVNGNTAENGGGILNLRFAHLTNSTVSNNAAKNGGGIHEGHDLVLTNTTVSSNTATYAGGGIHAQTGADVRNTIIARNSAPDGSDAKGTFDSHGGNLIGNTAGSAGWSDTSDLKNVDPLLGPLQDNGGPTNTHALLSGSPAIDRASNTNCPSTDQRGVRRPQNGDRNSSAICDIGAFERIDLTPPRVTATTPTAGKTGVNRNANLTATFSEQMDRTTLTKSTFKLYRVNGDGTFTQVTNVAVGSTTDGLKAILNPFGTSTTLLAANSRYRAVVTTGTKDRAGNRLDQNTTATGNQPMVWTFTTGSS